jgi:hypothetical protein
LAPAPEIEVSNTKVGAVRNSQCRLQRRQQLIINVVEDSWHQARRPDFRFCKKSQL